VFGVKILNNPLALDDEEEVNFWYTFPNSRILKQTGVYFTIHILTMIRKSVKTVLAPTCLLWIIWFPYI